MISLSIKQRTHPVRMKKHPSLRISCRESAFASPSPLTLWFLNHDHCMLSSRLKSTCIQKEWKSSFFTGKRKALNQWMCRYTLFQNWKEELNGQRGTTGTRESEWGSHCANRQSQAAHCGSTLINDQTHGAPDEGFKKYSSGHLRCCGDIFQQQ